MNYYLDGKIELFFMSLSIQTFDYQSIRIFKFIIRQFGNRMIHRWSY